MTLSYLNLLLVILLLAIPGYMVYIYDRLSIGKIVISFARMLIQLSALALCLWLLYKFDTWWLELLWLTVLVMAASFMMVSRTHIRSSVLFLPSCVGMFVSLLAVSAYLLAVVLQPEAALTARWFVPITSILMAHTLTTNISAVRTYFDSLSQDSLPYYTLLGNGASRLQALAPYITRALKSLMNPCAAGLSALGLFTMPMALSGLLLGGADAIQSVCLFVVLVIASITSSTLSVILILWMTDRRTFTKEGKLKAVFFNDKT